MIIIGGRNIIKGDGWSDSWSIETGWACNLNASLLSSWYGIWGDGIMVGTETCDDSNSNSGDGWSNLWHVEGGFRYELFLWILWLL